MWEAFKYYLKKEVQEIKYHIFKILSILVKYVVPVVVIFAKAMTVQEARSTIEVWALPVIGILAIIYWVLIRKALFRSKTEENLVKRLDVSKARPLRQIIVTLIDDVIMTPFIPLILFLFARVVESFAYKTSLCFLCITICFVIGGIFEIVDLLLEMTRTFKEVTGNDKQ